MKVPVPKRKPPIPEEEFQKTSIPRWWSEVVRRDGFYDVTDEAERMCERPSGPGPDSQTSIFNLAYREGYRAALKNLALIKPEQTETEE